MKNIDKHRETHLFIMYNFASFSEDEEQKLADFVNFVHQLCNLMNIEDFTINELNAKIAIVTIGEVKCRHTFAHGDDRICILTASEIIE